MKQILNFLMILSLAALLHAQNKNGVQENSAKFARQSEQVQRAAQEFIEVFNNLE